MAQDDNTDTIERICELATPIILQKQKLAFYNIPPPRLNIISPYPTYTKEQLDMRRKAEILKYSGVQQNTKTNSFTKKQLFANLAKNTGKSKKISQYLTNANTKLSCSSNITNPTSTTASNIPGPPMILQYDPKIPLYNYGNHKNNRSYAITNKFLDIEFIAYNKNIVDVIQKTQYSTFYDTIYNTDTPTFTYIGELGELAIKNSLGKLGNSFSIYTPIAAFFNASIGSTVLIINENGSEEIIQKDILTTDLSLNISISSIIIKMYYNNTLIKTVEPTIYNAQQHTEVVPNLPDNTFVTTVCNIKNARNINPDLALFYGINYIGMLKVNIPLDGIPLQTIYTFKYEANYTYNSNSVNNYLDYIQTGIFANLLKENRTDYIDNCEISSSPNNKTPFTPTMFTSYYM